jgi:acetyl-CoA carboxylase beta subunit
MTRVVLYRKEVFHDISMTSTGHHQDYKTQAKAKELIDRGSIHIGMHDTVLLCM